MLAFATFHHSLPVDTAIGAALLIACTALPLAVVVFARRDWRRARKAGRPPRRWLRAAGYLALTFMLGVLVDAFLIEPNLLTTTRLTVDLPNMPAGRELRVIHLSDTHITRHVRLHDRLVQRVAAEHPDLILITGDLLQPRWRGGQPQAARDLFGKLADIAPLYMILGNHEALPPVISPRWRLLRDEYADVTINGVPLRITGWRQTWHYWTPPELGAPPDRVNILMEHSPDYFDWAAKQGYDLALAGHTHGGQVRLPFWGAVVTSSDFGKRFEYGRFRIGRLTANVTRGLGQNPWPDPPLRFLCPPEMVVITLRNENNGKAVK